MNKGLVTSQNSSSHGKVTKRHSDIGLYIHIPFCAKRCHFCAFYLVIQEEKRVQRFLAALEMELRMYAAQLDHTGQQISTVYFGGGTPTALSPSQLARVLTLVEAEFSVTADPEVTIEATPESLTADYLDVFLDAGVTRLSVGIQTFDEQERRRLGLSSTREEALAGIELVKQTSFANFNLDLIYGVPGQTVLSWGQTLQEACAYEPAHLSCYALSLEEGTRFDVAFQRGELALVETDVERGFQAQAIACLALAGYNHYEISNWSKPQHACRHNLRYWQGRDYLGLGPSAQSYVAGCRFGNVTHLDDYCRKLECREIPVTEHEHLSMVQQEKERVVFGLRLLEGVSINPATVDEQHSTWKTSLASLVEEEYVVHRDSRLVLTDKGRQFADMVGEQLW